MRLIHTILDKPKRPSQALATGLLELSIMMWKTEQSLSWLNYCNVACSGCRRLSASVMQILWPGIEEVIQLRPFPCQINTVCILTFGCGLPNAALNLPNMGTFSTLMWLFFQLKPLFHELLFLSLRSQPSMISSYHLYTKLFALMALTAYACFGTFTSVNLSKPSSSSLLQMGDVSSPSEIATLKTSHWLRRWQITDWKSVNH